MKWLRMSNRFVLDRWMWIWPKIVTISLFRVSSRFGDCSLSFDDCWTTLSSQLSQAVFYSSSQLLIKELLSASLNSDQLREYLKILEKLWKFSRSIFPKSSSPWERYQDIFSLISPLIFLKEKRLCWSLHRLTFALVTPSSLFLLLDSPSYLKNELTVHHLQTGKALSFSSSPPLGASSLSPLSWICIFFLLYSFRWH